MWYNINTKEVGGDEAVIDTIIAEMANGNFSFAILIVGILQLVVMIRTSRKKNEKKGE